MPAGYQGDVISTAKDGTTRTLKEESGPPLEMLWTPGHPHASVGMSVGKSVGYGELKISATVRYECDQNEETVNEAGKRAFAKALELANDGWQILLAEGQTG